MPHPAIADAGFEKYDGFIQSYRMFHIKPFTRKEMYSILGKPHSGNCRQTLKDSDGKVSAQWKFMRHGAFFHEAKYLSVWDYTGSASEKFWSAYGDEDTLVSIFGKENVHRS